MKSKIKRKLPLLKPSNFKNKKTYFLALFNQREVVERSFFISVNSFVFAQDFPPPPPPQGGDSGGAVGGSAPIGGGTIILIIGGFAYLVFKLKKENRLEK
mgnify:CR=1 FL=1